MARKKFKTVAGYLRSMGDDLYFAQEKAKLAGRPAISDEEGQRQILNNLMPFLEIKDRIGFNEKPLDAIERMRKAAATEKQAKALDTCLKWLKQPRVRMEVISASAPINTGIIFAGKNFTEEEFAKIKQFARERAIPLRQAVDEFCAVLAKEQQTEQCK
jgi:hypothetical protein